MKTSVFTIPVTKISAWYPDALVKCLCELGHDSKVVHDPISCDGDDVTFLVLFARHAHNTARKAYQQVKKHSKKVVYVQTEQIHINKGYFNAFRIAQDYCDCVCECSVEIMDFTKANSNIPVFSFPMGYHKSMTDVDFVDRKNMGWQIFNVERHEGDRKAYYELLDRNGFVVFDKIPIVDKKLIGCYAYNSDVCFSANFYGKEASMSLSRIVGLFMANRGFVITRRGRNPFFEDKKHLVYFDSPDDAVDKIKHYLIEKDEARSIANNAFEYINSAFLMVNIVKDTIERICS